MKQTEKEYFYVQAPFGEVRVRSVVLYEEPLRWVESLGTRTKNLFKKWLLAQPSLTFFQIIEVIL